MLYGKLDLKYYLQLSFMATKFKNKSIVLLNRETLTLLTISVQTCTGTLLSLSNHVPLYLTILIYITVSVLHKIFVHRNKIIKIKIYSRYTALVCKVKTNSNIRSTKLHNNIWMKLLTGAKWIKSVINFTMHYYTLSFSTVHIFVCVT